MKATPQAEPHDVLAVGAVVVDRKRRVLLVRRARPPNVGIWTLPGGHVEKGETCEAAIVREVLEETALATRVIAPLGIVRIAREGFAYAIHEYLLVAIDDATLLVPGDDAAEAQWAARAEMAALGVWPDVIGVVDRGLAEDGSRRRVR